MLLKSIIIDEKEYINTKKVEKSMPGLSEKNYKSGRKAAYRYVIGQAGMVVGFIGLFIRR